MTADLLSAQSPLAGWQPAFDSIPGPVQVREVPLLSHLDLRVDPSGPAAVAVAAVLGTPLPTQPNTSARDGDRRVLWMGPDEWLVLAAPGAAGELEAALRQAIGRAPGSVTDVSAQRTTLTLTGPAARDLLARGCAIDLHPRVSPAGTCVQTLLARAGIVIVVDDDTATRFLLLVRSSFAGYLAAWLVDAGTELR